MNPKFSDSEWNKVVWKVENDGRKVQKQAKAMIDC